MRRFGQVIGVRPDRIEDYEAIHREVWPEVLELIHQSNIRNYTIFRNGTQLFAYFEYVGDDFMGDMKAMSEHPVNKKWWALTDPMQEPAPDRAEGEWWKSIPEVFHTD
jgi:L-rhamnose mutarotase